MQRVEIVSGGAGADSPATPSTGQPTSDTLPPIPPDVALSTVGATAPAIGGGPTVPEGDVPEKIQVNFALTYGGVTSIETPVAVGGRYEGMALGGPAKAFDRLLDKWLTRALDLGMVGSKLGQLFPIHLQNSVEEKRVKASYLFLVGLGEPGTFASDDLQFVISNVVVAVKSLRAREFVCDLIGTRRGELTVEQAVRAFAQGIVDGYVRFGTILKGVTTNRTGFVDAVAQSLTIVLAEADRKKLERIESALEEIKSENAFPKLAITVSHRPDVSPDSIPEANAIDTDPDVPVSLLRVTRREGNPDTPGSDDITTLEFTALSDTASVPVRQQSITTYFVRRIPERLIATSSVETRERLGLFLTNCLIPDDFRRVTDGAGNLILEVDETTANYPLETAAHRRYARTTFLGATKAVSRQFRSMTAPAPSSPPPLNKELKVLVIADPAPTPYS
ncbi:MAG: M17 family peptidase N-terminal domain-containing protein, partial [Roseiarcus sp.]